MGQGEIRIGIVGAGRSVRKRHIPGFRKLGGVRIVGVCNRHRESAARAARDFDIPRIYSNWEELISDPDIDAVLIGAWPYLHCPVTLAALDAGKHVLTQARMAMNARESQRMLDKAKEHPSLTAMIVPSPFGLSGEAFVRSLMADGFLGELREIRVDSFNGELADPDTPMNWRQMTRYSGFNMLTLGVVYETLLRWAPPADRVLGYASKLVERRLDPELGKVTRVGISDCVQVLTTHEGGAVGTFRLSGVSRHERTMSITMIGSEGTLVYDLLADEIRGAGSDEPELKPLPIPPELRGRWRAEEEFIAAIRGERPVTHTDFASGARYMQFTEAVARSSRHQVPVRLPLQEFSNPSL